MCLALRSLAISAGLLCLLLSGPVQAFTDCSDDGYLATADARVRGSGAACVEAVRFQIPTPKGSRQVRIVHTTDLPTLDLPAMVSEIRRGIERSAAKLPELGALAPDDITVWISHFLTETAHSDAETAEDILGVATVMSDGCLVAVYPAATGARGLAATSAHEFFHCVQASEFPRTYDLAGSEWWSEGTAEWFTFLVFPHLDDAGFIASFDAISPRTPLTSMSYESVVFFAWLGETQGYHSITRLMQAMPAAEGEAAQQNALAAFLRPEQWQAFAQAYLDRRIRRPGGRALASTPFPGDIYVWGQPSRSHRITADRFVLARAQLEFACGLWSIVEEPHAGTRAYREQNGAWQDQLPERIVVETGAPRLFQVAGFGTGNDGFSLGIEGIQDMCQGCPDQAAAAEELDRCLIGTWELVSGGYGASIEAQLREAGIFQEIDYPDLHRYFVLQANGRYRQAPSDGGESGSMTTHTPSGKRWEGLTTLRMDTTGSWSADGQTLHLCEEQRTLSIDLSIINPKGVEERISSGEEDEQTMSLPRQRQYACGESRLSLTESAPNVPSVHWEYQRR